MIRLRHALVILRHHFRGIVMSKDWIIGELDAHLVVVFSKTYCPYCKRVKETLKDVGLKDFTVHELDERDDGEPLQNILAEMTGGRTVPRVFVKGEFIGGCDDTIKLKKSGELATKLKAVGAL
eukprot:m.2815 g.2815  ORF g.2815 m.2815 type:complete len:123 (+) comp8922_c0_seq1:1032-1400(+)